MFHILEGVTHRFTDDEVKRGEEDDCRNCSEKNKVVNDCNNLCRTRVHDLHGASQQSQRNLIRSYPAR